MSSRLKKGEMRVGNLVFNKYQLRHEPLTILGLDSIFAETGPAGLLRGVPITPGWAEQLGGEYQVDLPITTYRFYNSKRTKYVAIQFSKSYGEVLLGYHTVGVQFVHEFQNLYFFVTGQELFLKPIEYTKDDDA